MPRSLRALVIPQLDVSKTMKYKAIILQINSHEDRTSLIIQFDERDNPSDFNHGKINEVIFYKNNVLVGRKFVIENLYIKNTETVKKFVEGQIVDFEKLDL